MDGFEFTASLVKNLAWPVTVLATLFLLIVHGRRLAYVVKSFKYKDFEIQLREDFEDAKDIASQLPLPIANIEPNDVLRIAEIDPNVAVLKSWQRVEKLMNLLPKSELAPTVNGFEMRYMRNGKLVANANSLDPHQRALYGHLKSIRNEVVHTHRTLTLAEVTEYDQLVNVLIDQIKRTHKVDLPKE